MDRYFVTHYFWLNGDIYLPAETNARYRRLAMLDFGGFHNRIRPPFSQPCLILIHIDTGDQRWLAGKSPLIFPWKIPIDMVNPHWYSHGNGKSPLIFPWNPHWYPIYVGDFQLAMDDSLEAKFEDLVKWQQRHLCPPLSLGRGIRGSHGTAEV